MSQYYNPKRKYNLFDPESKDIFKLSRSKIDLFLSCPRCFYLDRRLGVGRPPGYPFSLNSAVDFLLKKEFDIHRAENKAHPFMEEYCLNLIPFSHPKLNEWRENFKGVQYFHEPTNLIITGAVDDLWVDKEKIVYVVDYKATSKDGDVNLDAEWQDGYKRQMEIYQWLLRRNDLKISDTGYFVYCNGKKDVKAFDGKLEFDVKIIPYKGDDFWVEKAIVDAHKCMMNNKIPLANSECDYCAYREEAAKEELSK
ncbi:PD-(D/E)XK nuclease family protein [Patescibacteria group bacterium]|nr:PD-(D/E)XK nuclease family protein [Patescibacteria group bacterium]MBU2579974.1 PD-(D/E)XK nuclease family protein [Patescibacteria group bacterium]